MTTNSARQIDVPFLQKTNSHPTNVSQTHRRAPRVVELKEVVVTGIGVILPNCDSREQFWRHLSLGETQLTIEKDPADHLPCAIGRVGDFDAERYLGTIPRRAYAHSHREQLFYLCSIAQALSDAGFEAENLRGQPVGLFDGTSRGSFAYWYDLMRAHAVSPGSRLTLKEIGRGMPGQAVGIAAAAFGFTGPTFTFNGTCASGVIAVGNAFHELQSGRCEMALATGHDVALIEPLYQMYRDANLLSPEGEEPARAISPYSEHRGNAFGEGAVTLVLETIEHAARRGAKPLARVSGFRHANGGSHPTDVDFIGDRPWQVIQDVMNEAQTDADGVDFVLGHGNGVRASDISELNYMKRVFGARSMDVPLISTKPIYGHTLGASSALNVAAAVLMLQNDFLIPTIGIDESRIVRGFNHQPNVGRAARLRSGLVMAYGIGGQNATVLIEKADR